MSTDRGIKLRTNNSTSPSPDFVSPSSNQIAIPSASILPFPKVLAQTHHSSQTVGTDSIRSIPHQNLSLVMLHHNSAEKHHQQ
jgi:hypothetical protein